MGVVAWVVGIVLILAYLMVGGMKVIGHPSTIEASERLGFAHLRRYIGLAEILGAVGLFLGLLSDGSLEWVGVLAAVDLIVIMIGAVIYHSRGGDEPKETAPAAVLGLLCVLYIVAIAAR